MKAENTRAEDPQNMGRVRSGPEGMPLGARRLLMIGGLCLPVGLFGGPYLLPAQLLAVSGIILLAVALSYQAGDRWFSRWPRIVAAAGVLWLAATSSYYASIMIAADASAPLPGFAQLLFNAGAVCFAAMALSAVTGIVLRMLANRRRAGVGTTDPRG